jgi:hypothetical protein
MMDANEQATMDALSRNVTLLCMAIDPHCTHGPEAEKIVKHGINIRRVAIYLSRRYGKDDDQALQLAANELRILLES